MKASAAPASAGPQAAALPIPVSARVRELERR
ncbi:hypothetical protein HaLaN_29168, partial [Haematococcus lacustris]